MKKICSFFIVCMLALSMSGCFLFSHSCTVTFDAGEYASFEAIVVDRGQTIVAPEPDVEGQTFLGWFYDSAFEDRYYATDVITADVTLYASFTPEIVTPTENATFATTNGGYALTAFVPSTHVAKLPSTFEGQPVVKICSNVFGEYASKVTVVDIPDTVTSIESYAFAGCTYLEYLYIPASVTSLGQSVVGGSSMIKYFEIAGNPSLSAPTFSDTPFWGMAILAARGSQADVVVKNQTHSAYPSGPVNYGKLAPDGILASPVTVTQRGAHVPAFTDNARTLAIDARPAGRAVVCSEGLLDVVRKGYRPTFENASSGVAQLYDNARAVLARICTDSMTDVEKLHAIYDWITATVTYDHATANDTGDSNRNWFNAAYFLEGVFVNGLAVCDGYAKAMELLCAMEGIECVRVVGTRYGPHAWNKIKLDGKWYHTDATHGDVVFSGISGEITDHDQLLSAEKSGYVAFAPYASYLATDSSFSYWQSVQTAQGMDARIDSEDELCAFIAYAKEDLLAGEIVQLWMTTAIKDVARELRIALNSAGLNVNNFQFFSASFESGTSFNNSIYIIPSNLVQGAAA